MVAFRVTRRYGSAVCELYQLAVAVIGLGVLAWLTPGLAHVPAASFAALATVYVVAALVTYDRAASAGYFVGFSLLVVGVITLSAAAGAWMGVGLLLVRSITKRPVPLRLLFNVGQWTLACLAAGWAFAAVRGPIGPPTARWLVADLAAVAAFDWVHIIIVAGRRVMEEHRSWRATAQDLWAKRRATTLFYYAAPVAMAALVQSDGAMGAVIGALLVVAGSQAFWLNHQLEESRRQALTDQLTQVYNHRYFAQWLNAELEGRDPQRPVSILFVDYNGLKLVNDRCGHLAGDAALRRVAKLLVEHTRETDTVLRYGGDEFLVLMPGSDADAALAVARRIGVVARQSVLDWDGRQVNLTVSIGVASYPRHTNLLQELVLLADRAMYQSKEQGLGLPVAVAP